MKETETQKAIEQEAEEKYPYKIIAGLNRKAAESLVIFPQREAYIAGRSKSLEEKEKEIAELKDALGYANKALKISLDAASNIGVEKDKRIGELEEALRGIVDSCEFFADGRKFDGNHKEALKLILGKAKQLLNNH